MHPRAPQARASARNLHGERLHPLGRRWADVAVPRHRCRGGCLSLW